MGAGRRHAFPGKDHELGQPGGASVPVAEGVYPREVQVQVDGAQNRRRGAVLAPIGAHRPAVSLQPLAEPAQQEGAVLAGGAPVAKDSDGVRGNLPGHDTVLQVIFETLEQAPVGPGDPVRRQRRRAASHGPVEDVVDRPEHVVDFRLQVLLGRRKVEPPLRMGRDLLLAQRVSLDRRRAPDALHQIEPVHSPGVGRRKNGLRDLIAPGGRLAQQRPVEGVGALQVVPEADPRMRTVVSAVVRHGRAAGCVG